MYIYISIYILKHTQDFWRLAVILSSSGGKHTGSAGVNTHADINVCSRTEEVKTLHSTWMFLRKVILNINLAKINSLFSKYLWSICCNMRVTTVNLAQDLVSDRICLMLTMLKRRVLRILLFY